MGFKMSVAGILVLIAALLAVLSFFLAWTSIGPISWNGLDYLDTGEAVGYAPLLIMIVGIVALILALLPMLDVKLLAAPIDKILTMVFGVLIIVFFVWCATAEGRNFDYLGIGAWLALISGILLIVVPLLALLKVLPEE